MRAEGTSLQSVIYSNSLVKQNKSDAETWVALTYNCNFNFIIPSLICTNAVKPKPGAYTACGQNDRDYFI